MTNMIQGSTQEGGLNIKNMTTGEVVLPELDVAKRATSNFHIDYKQGIH